MNWSGFYDKIDLHREHISRGENAMFWHDGHGFTPPQRALFQDQLDRFYTRFVGKVAMGRDLSYEDVDRVARGRVWSGRQALEVGLVDGLGGLQRSLASIKALVGAAPDEKIRVRTFGKELGWFERTMLDALRSSGAGGGAGAPRSAGDVADAPGGAGRSLARLGRGRRRALAGRSAGGAHDVAAVADPRRADAVAAEVQAQGQQPQQPGGSHLVLAGGGAQRWRVAPQQVTAVGGMAPEQHGVTQFVGQAPHGVGAGAGGVVVVAGGDAHPQRPAQ